MKQFIKIDYNGRRYFILTHSIVSLSAIGEQCDISLSNNTTMTVNYTIGTILNMIGIDPME